MHRIRSKWCLTLVLLLIPVAALARLDRETVEAAWERVTEADGFERVPIEYEEDGGPNAWVAFEDGGKYSVHVTQEMMNVLESEEEMAGILGHEIGHIRLGHYNQEVLADIGQSLLETHKDKMTDLAGAVGSIGVELTKSLFSREQETEADEYGVELLVEAGYSPWGLYNAMKHFGAEDQATKGFDTHPGTGPRLEYLAELAMAEEDGGDEEDRQPVGDRLAESAEKPASGDIASQDVSGEDGGDPVRGETARRAMGYAPPPMDVSYLSKNPPKNITKRALSTNIPAKYDLRNTGRLTPVKDQGEYGTCWSHATMAACESNYLTRAKKGNFSGALGDARTLNLSEMYLAWFAYHNPDRTKAFPPHDEKTGKPVYSMEGRDILDQGGNEWRSTAILSRLGLVAESSMPYGRFPSNAAKPGGYPRVLRVKEATIAILEEGSPEQLRIVKQLIMDKGAVLISYDEDSPYHDNRHHSYFKKGSKTTNHMIAVVGWDDNYPRQNFGKDKPSRDGAWLCRNSWGPKWGAGGYFWMSYEQYHRSGTAFTVEPLKEKMRHYGHENLGWVNSIFLGRQKKNGFEAAVFQVLGDGESVSEAGFYTTDNGTRYTVSVYLHGTETPTAASLTSGEPVAEKSGTFDLAGYHTVKLPKDVPVKKGEWFSIVVKLTNPSHDYPLAVEMRSRGYTENVEVSAGNSYFSSDGKTWTDGAKLPELSKNFSPSNATVKAFTLCGEAALEPTPEPAPADEEDEDEDRYEDEEEEEDDDDDDDDRGEDDEYEEEDYEDYDEDYDDEYDEDWDDEDYEEDEDEDWDDEDEEGGVYEEEDEDFDEDEEDEEDDPRPYKPILPDGFNEEDYEVGIILIPKRR